MAFGAVGWALTFWHFSYLLPGPTEHGLNFVTLWLATGLLMASAPLLQGWNWRGQSNSTRRGAEEVA